MTRTTPDCTVLHDVYTRAREQLDCLPRTGSDVLDIAVIGLLVLCAGVGLALLLRRGDRAS